MLTVPVADYDASFRPARRGFQVTPQHEAAVAQLGAAPGDRVLDLGCGAGELMSLLGAVGAKTIGVDYSREALSVTKRALPGAAILRGNATSLPFPSASFDRVAALGVLGFLSPTDLRSALRECARVLRPGGLLVICTGSPLNRIGWLLLTLRSGAWRRPQSRSNIYPASTYVRELQRLGFSVASWRTWYGAGRGLRSRLLHPFMAPLWIRASLDASRR